MTALSPTSRLTLNLLAELKMTDVFQLRQVARDADASTPAGKAQEVLAMLAANAIMRLENAEKGARYTLDQVNEAVVSQAKSLEAGDAPRAEAIAHAASRYAESAAKVAELVSQFETTAVPLKALLGIEI